MCICLYYSCIPLSTVIVYFQTRFEICFYIKNLSVYLDLQRVKKKHDSNLVFGAIIYYIICNFYIFWIKLKKIKTINRGFYQ